MGQDVFVKLFDLIESIFSDFAIVRNSALDSKIARLRNLASNAELSEENFFPLQSAIRNRDLHGPQISFRFVDKSCNTINGIARHDSVMFYWRHIISDKTIECLNTIVQQL